MRQRSNWARGLKIFDERTFHADYCQSLRIKGKRTRSSQVVGKAPRPKDIMDMEQLEAWSRRGRSTHSLSLNRKEGVANSVAASQDALALLATNTE